jgi:hypothetical protein
VAYRESLARPLLIFPGIVRLLLCGLCATPTEIPQDGNGFCSATTRRHTILPLRGLGQSAFWVVKFNPGRTRQRPGVFMRWRPLDCMSLL